MDLERTHPIFHQKVAHKNREFTTGLFSDSPLKKQVIPGGSCAGILQRGMRERLGGSYYFTTRQRKGGSEERRGGSEGRSETGYWINRAFSGQVPHERIKSVAFERWNPSPNNVIQDSKIAVKLFSAEAESLD